MHLFAMIELFIELFISSLGVYFSKLIILISADSLNTIYCFIPHQFTFIS